jgi:hypothetical protein
MKQMLRPTQAPRTQGETASRALGIIMQDGEIARKLFSNYPVTPAHICEALKECYPEVVVPYGEDEVRNAIESEGYFEFRATSRGNGSIVYELRTNTEELQVSISYGYVLLFCNKPNVRIRSYRPSSCAA